MARRGGEDWAWDMISGERRALADLLEGLTPEQWEARSLCSVWRVRDVAAHVSLVPDPPSVLALALGAIRAGGSFHRLNRVMTAGKAGMTPEALVADLREHADSRRIPAVTNTQNVLFDVLVHAQDIAVPLGIPHPLDPEAGQAAADRVWTMGWPFHARRRFRGLRLVATDADWSVGSGPEVTGPIRAMLLALTGRPAGLADLTTADPAPLAARLGVTGPQPSTTPTERQ